MNISQYIKRAKMVLKEHAGSEGLKYIVFAKSGLKAVKNEKYEISEVASENGGQKATVDFVYPHDWGFAINTLKEELGVEITGLQLIY